MPSPVQPGHSSEGEKHNKQLNKEIGEMVSAITHRLTNFHKPGSSHQNKENNHDLSMVNLVGNNNGATMRSELLDAKKSGDDEPDHDEALNTFVNSNFQAINNSLMFGGSYQANDPGVHMDISDFSTEQHHHQSHLQKEEKHGKKGKKIEKKASKLPKESSSSSSSDSN